MTIEDWLACACADADRRGLADLKPLLETLAESTRALREGSWDETGRQATVQGAPEPPAPPTAGGGNR